MSAHEKVGEEIWKGFHEALGDRIWRAFGIFPEGYILFRKAIESYDAGAIEGAVLLCRAALESEFLLFLSFHWGTDSSFNIVYPTTLDGRLKVVGFDELRDAIVQRVSFSREQVNAINRVHQNGNFVAHYASRKIKQRLARVDRYQRWEAHHKGATDIEKYRAIQEILQSETPWITPTAALHDLRDTSSILLKVGMAMGKP